MGKAISQVAAMTAMLLLSAAVAFAAPNVEVKIKAEKEKVVVKEGKKVSKMVAVKNTVPGDIVRYTILYRNIGDEPATNAVISDPIPDGTVYIPGSASDAAELTFSIDKGKTFNKPELLVTTGRDKRVATPEEYTTLRWVISKIPAGAKGEVSFKVKIK